MQSNELRLGNYVSVISDVLDPFLNDHGLEGIDNAFKVVSVDSLNVNISIDGLECELFLYDYKPIPLTEDWAKLKFDFINTKGRKGNGFDYQPETSKTNQSKYNIGNEIELVFERWSYRKTENYDWIHEDSIHIDYYGDCISLYKYEVHVLQNLYFALTGEELTIKE